MMRMLLRPPIRGPLPASTSLRTRLFSSIPASRGTASQHHQHGGHNQHGSHRGPLGLTQWQAAAVLAGGAYLASTRAQADPAVELSWSELSQLLLPSGLVDKLEVVGGTRIHVHLSPHADLLSHGINFSGPLADAKHFVVPVPSTEWAESHIDAALDALPLQEGFVSTPSVRYTDSYAWEAVWALGPTLAFCAFLLFLDGARQRVVPGPTATGLSWRSGAKLSDVARSLLGTRTADAPTRSAVTLESVAGLGPAKGEVEELVSFLTSQHTHRARELGARVPRGALLTGPPGTGKTFLARALAGEAGVPMFACSGSEFSDTYVGVGPARVRELFERARANAPSLIFVDEIDALARARGSGQTGCDEREATLNELLVQLDGFSTQENVLVLAATNRPDVLDEAVKRAGRFDRHIALPPPDEEGRREIFTVHLSPLLLDPALDKAQVSSTLAAATPGWSGAAIASVCNDAALLAARKGAECVTQAHLDLAVGRVQRGPLGPRPALSREEMDTAALHTAARIAARWFLPLTSGVSRAGVGVSASSAPGWIVAPPPGALSSKMELSERLAALVAGRAAAGLFLSSMTTASRDELVEATELAKEMVGRYGMDAMGPLVLTAPADEPEFTSQATHSAVDAAVQGLMNTALERATLVLKQHEDQVKALANELSQHTTLGAHQIEACLGPRSVRHRQTCSIPSATPRAPLMTM